MCWDSTGRGLAGHVEDLMLGLFYVTAPAGPFGCVTGHIRAAQRMFLATPEIPLPSCIFGSSLTREGILSVLSDARGFDWAGLNDRSGAPVGVPLPHDKLLLVPGDKYPVSPDVSGAV